MPSYEEILENQVRSIGPWQWRSLVLFIFSTPFALIFFPVFAGFRPFHFCRPKSFHLHNWTVSQWINLTVPLFDETEPRSQPFEGCRSYHLLDSVKTNTTFVEAKELMENAINGGNYTPQTCTNGWIYLKDSVVYRDTFIETFDLVCDRAYLHIWSTVIFMIGFLIGAALFGFIGDRYGRQRVSILALILCVASSILTSMAPSIWIFMVGRFLAGIFTQGHHVVTFSLVMEISGPSARDIFNTLCTFLIGVMLPLWYAMLAYFIQNWRWLHLAMTSNLLLVALYFRFMPESPRWLLTQGRQSEAIEVLKRGARINHSGAEIQISLDDCKLEENPSISSKTRHLSTLTLFRTSLMRRITFLMILTWFSHSLSFYGASFYTVKLPGVSPYLSFSVPSAIKAFFLCGQYLLARQFLRRPCLVGYQLIGVLCCSVVAFFYLLPGVSDNLKNIFSVTFMSIFLGSVLSGFAVIYVYTSELFPTSLRSRGLGICSVFSRIGAALAPMVVDLDRALGHRWLPMAVCGIVQLLACFGSFFLPETKNRPLSDTPEELKVNLKPVKRRNEGNIDSVQLKPLSSIDC